MKQRYLSKAHKRVIIIIFFYIFMIIKLFSLSKAPPIERTKEFYDNVKLVYEWFFDEGIAGFYSDSENFDSRRIVYDKFGVASYLSLSENYGVRVLSTIFMQGWIMCRMECVRQLKLDNGVYEYWVVSFYSWNRTDVDLNEIFFQITFSENITSKRNIIKSSEKFFESHELGNQQEIKFPSDNIMLLSSLRLWDFPNAISGTILDGHYDKFIKYLDKERTKSLNEFRVLDKYDEFGQPIYKTIKYTYDRKTRLLEIIDEK